MPISGAFIMCRPGEAEELSRSLAKEEVVDIHGVLAIRPDCSGHWGR